MAKYQFEFVFGVGILFIMLVMGGFFMWLAADAQKRWGGYLNNGYQQTLEEVRRQEWYEHQKKLKEYELFLQQQKEKEQANESSN